MSDFNNSEVHTYITYFNYDTHLQESKRCRVITNSRVKLQGRDIELLGQSIAVGSWDKTVSSTLDIFKKNKRKFD